MATLQDTIAKLVDKKYESLSPKQLVDAPVAALSGVSDADAEALRKAFGIKTIGDLARSKYVAAAQALTALADHE